MSSVKKSRASNCGEFLVSFFSLTILNSEVRVNFEILIKIENPSLNHPNFVSLL